MPKMGAATDLCPFSSYYMTTRIKAVSFDLVAAMTDYTDQDIEDSGIDVFIFESGAFFYPDFSRKVASVKFIMNLFKSRTGKMGLAKSYDLYKSSRDNQLPIFIGSENFDLAQEIAVGNFYNESPEIPKPTFRFVNIIEK